MPSHTDIEIAVFLVLTSLIVFVTVFYKEA
jgi:hypothetical protein